MINSIDLSRLRNGEYAQLMQDILAIVYKNDPAAMQVSAQYNKLKEIGDEIEALFKVPAGSTVTQELEEYDLLRDNALSGILDMISAYSYSADPVLKKHSDVLSAHLAMFGTNNITRDNYQSETASIRNIIADWDKKPELADALTALNLLPWKANLAAANEKFGDKYLNRAQELGTATADSLKEKRLQANEAYYSLRNRIDARFVISDGAEPYSTVTAIINGLLDSYNMLLARRGGTDAAVEEPVAA